MDAIDAIRTRRSVRAYEDRPVDRGLIEAVLRDAAHAPWTPMSLPDPWVFKVIEGREAIAGYGARALDYARRNRPRLEGYQWTERPGFSVFHGAPVVVIICARSAYPVALEECTRAGQVLSLAAHARGLGSCWVGSPGLWLADPAVRTELGIPDGLAPYAAFCLGHPAPPAPDAPAPTTLEPRILWPDA